MERGPRDPSTAPFLFSFLAGKWTNFFLWGPGEGGGWREGGKASTRSTVSYAGWKGERGGFASCKWAFLVHGLLPLSLLPNPFFSLCHLFWTFHETLPPDHLLLDSAPNLGKLISRWELDKFKNCWNKSFRTSNILTFLYQQFSNLLHSQKDMSGPRLGALSNNMWSGGTTRLSFSFKEQTVVEWSVQSMHWFNTVLLSSLSR